MTPALTPEEWGVGGKKDGNGGVVYIGSAGAYLGDDAGDTASLPLHMRHAVAALCLYQQTFGFTQADVEVLTIEGGHRPDCDEWGLSDYRPCCNCDIPEKRQAIAAKIVALLPPETP